jgi:integrase
VRDLTMLNLALDSKLRGRDVVALKVENVAPNGYAVDRATVRQKKTGQPVRFELIELTREAVDADIKSEGDNPGPFLFVGHRASARAMTTRQYARLVRPGGRNARLEKRAQQVTRSVCPKPLE